MSGNLTSVLNQINTLRDRIASTPPDQRKYLKGTTSSLNPNYPDMGRLLFSNSNKSVLNDRHFSSSRSPLPTSTAAQSVQTSAIGIDNTSSLPFQAQQAPSPITTESASTTEQPTTSDTSHYDTADSLADSNNFVDNSGFGQMMFQLFGNVLSNVLGGLFGRLLGNS